MSTLLSVLNVCTVEVIGRFHCFKSHWNSNQIKKDWKLSCFAKINKSIIQKELEGQIDQAVNPK